MRRRRMGLGAGLGMVWVAGCPTAKPVLPALPEAGSSTGGSSEGTSTGGASGVVDTGSSSAAGAGTTETGEAGSSSGEPPLCELPGDACAAPSSAWWDDAWAYRRPVTITSPLASPLVDAIVPVRLDETFDFGCARIDGADLRFVDDDGIVFPHELDQWQPGEGAVAWVRVGQLDVAGQSLWLYHGNERALAPTDEVWPASLGMQAVLHFGGDLDDARGEHHGRPAVDGARPQYTSQGIVGAAVHYEPILFNARVELMGSDAIDDAIEAAGAMTVTTWVHSTPAVASPTEYQTVVTRGSELWSLIVYSEGDSTFLPPAFMLFLSRCLGCAAPLDPFGNHRLLGSTSVIEDPVEPAWHHVAIVHEWQDPDYRKALYVDGELDEEYIGAVTFPWELTPFDTASITIGAGQGVDAGLYAFHGEIDEVRIASATWEPARVRAEHAFGRDPKLVSVAAPECR